MAKMIPNTIKEFPKASREDIIYDSLKKLSDEYYVFHSFQTTAFKDDVLKDGEVDFVIFHPKKGIMCIEAKSGQVEYLNGEWFYASGIKMKNGGPYNQASKNKHKIKDQLKDIGIECRVTHAVWFHSLNQSSLNNKLKNGADGSLLKITLSKDDLDNPQKKNR